MSLKQDRAGTRTAEDLRRRLNVKAIDESVEKVEESAGTVEELNRKVNNLVSDVNNLDSTIDNTRKNYISTFNQTFTEEQKQRARSNIGAGNSTFSGSYEDLSDKPSSLSDINSEESTKLTNIENDAQKNVIETIKVNGTAQEVTDKTIDLTIPTYNESSYDLSSYKISSVTMLRSSCVVKNNRVCINCVCSSSMAANTTTTLFNLPSALRPTATKDFVAYGQIDNNNGSLGYGYITSDGLLQVRFEDAVTSYIRFSFVYDLD